MDKLYKFMMVMLVLLLGFLSVLAIDDQCYRFTGQGGEILRAVSEYIEI